MVTKGSAVRHKAEPALKQSLRRVVCDKSPGQIKHYSLIILIT